MALASLLWLVVPNDAAAQKPSGKNAVNGGFGFQTGLSRWAPGGFKWFNDYNRELSKMVWLNMGLNATVGNAGRDRCWYDNRRDRWVCENRHWDGNSIEFVLGVRLRFELKKLPLVIDAKLGGASDIIFFGGEYGAATFAFRGGPGVHYFFFDNLGVGAEFTFTLGPAFTRPEGPEFYAAFDFQVIGIEFRF